MTVVTSTGNHLTVNAYPHADLFWALRGGGGGTYGIVTSATYRSYPSVPIVASVFAASAANSSIMRGLWLETYAAFPSLADGGWGGYGGVSNSTLGSCTSPRMYREPKRTRPGIRCLHVRLTRVSRLRPRRRHIIHRFSRFTTRSSQNQLARADSTSSLDHDSFLRRRMRQTTRRSPKRCFGYPECLGCAYLPQTLAIAD